MYYIVEIQENADGTGAMLTYTAPTENEAESKWHDILKYAAISTVYKHTAVIMDNVGRYKQRGSYTHYAQEVESNEG
jgi:hypothetical protein